MVGAPVIQWQGYECHPRIQSDSRCHEVGCVAPDAFRPARLNRESLALALGLHYEVQPEEVLVPGVGESQLKEL